MMMEIITSNGPDYNHTLYTRDPLGTASHGNHNQIIMNELTVTLIICLLALIDTLINIPMER